MDIYSQILSWQEACYAWQEVAVRGPMLAFCFGAGDDEQGIY